jgi:gluconate 2-dehydrogenase gamma chain
MRRRQFLNLTAWSVGGVLVYSLSGKPSRLVADDKRLRIPLRFFTEPEALIVAAAAARIFPTDESGPGAQEAGVVIYIDRQLEGPYGRDRHRYTQPPFEEGPPQLGYQGKATPREIYREALKGLAGFDRQPASEQDAKLKQIESSLFFAVLREHTLEGMFCDPMHGGNIDMIGWQLIGFPGPRLSNFEDVDKHFGEAFRPRAYSLRQMMGDGGRPSEDEQ